MTLAAAAVPGTISTNDSAWIQRERVLDQIDRLKAAKARQLRLQHRAEARASLPQIVGTGLHLKPPPTPLPPGRADLLNQKLRPYYTAFGFAGALAGLVSFQSARRWFVQVQRAFAPRKFSLVEGQAGRFLKLPVWVLTPTYGLAEGGVGRLLPTLLRGRKKPVSKAHATAEDSEPDLPFRLACQLFDELPGSLESLRCEFDLLNKLSDPPEYQELLLSLYLHTHSITCKAAWLNLRSAVQVGTALQAFLLKLDKSGLVPQSGHLRTASLALEVFEHLCQPWLPRDLGLEPPLRFLVVDADASSRAVIQSGLQMHFTRPDAADTAQAALDLAAQHTYDVVVIDSVLPGTDVPGLIRDLRNAGGNSRTEMLVLAPVTMEIQEGAPTSDYTVLQQPASLAELNLAVRTLALRKRLQLET